mgnify:CR=1 FL=1|tara:strand:- start:171 stop:548 length:378 start_codon:yes stop_codon:yes gene_type:complete
MHFSIIYNTTCNSDPTNHSCINNLIEKLRSWGLNLRAEKTGDKVNGGLVLTHFQNAHLAEIEIYTKNEEPNQDHSGYFIKATKSEKQIKTKIETMFTKNIPAGALKLATDEDNKNMPTRIKGIQH